MVAVGWFAVPAFAATTYYGGNHDTGGDLDVLSYQYHVLTDDWAENGSCFGNGTDCGVELGTMAWTTSNTQWGPEYYGVDYAYHTFSNKNLMGVFEEDVGDAAPNGAWIYGALDY